MVSFANFTGFGKDQALERNVIQIQNIIRLAQTNASSGLKCNGTIDSAGWIVEFSGTSSSPIIKLICINAITGLDDTNVKPYSLDPNASIDSVSPIGACTSYSFPSPSNSAAIVFGSSIGKNSFIFDRMLTSPCASAKSINITVNYAGVSAAKTFGINLTGAISPSPSP